MAGSWNHMTKDDGTPYREDMAALMDTTGDLVEALWQCYGMIWWLAGHLDTMIQHTDSPGRETALDLIVQAQANWRDGVELGKGLP